jgi:hypothetical protein
MGLSFTIAAGPCERIHSQIRLLWDSWPYVTIPDSRLPFLSPPTTQRTVVEVFNPASTWECLLSNSGTSYNSSAWTTPKTHATCQTVSSLVHYQCWAGHGWHRKHSLLCCCVTQQQTVYTRTCLPTRCLAMGIHVIYNWQHNRFVYYEFVVLAVV